MSEEVAVKKRGRPKKVVPEAAVEEFVDTSKKSTTKKTKAKAAPKKSATAKPVKAELAKAKVIKIELPKAEILKAGTKKAEPMKQNITKKVSVLEEVKKLEASKRQAVKPKAAPAMSEHSATSPTTSTKTTVETTTPPSIEVESAQKEVPVSDSKILDEIETVSSEANSTSKPAEIENNSIIKPPISSTTTSTNPSPLPKEPPPPQTSPIMAKVNHKAPKNPTPSTPSQTPQPPPSPPQKPKPLGARSPAPNQISIKDLNSKIVADLTERAGAKNTVGGKAPNLPKGYNAVARKISMTIIALPILVVTSYVLFERLALPEERRQFKWYEADKWKNEGGAGVVGGGEEKASLPVVEGKSE